MGFPRTGISFFGLGAALLALSAGLAFSQSTDRLVKVSGPENSPEFIGPPYPQLRPALASQPASLLGGLGGDEALECSDIDAQFFASCTGNAALEQALPTQSGLVFSYNPVASHAPVPAPVSHRPILTVYPRDVALIWSVRAVSGDPLVHQLVPGSWPRRLDQVNALASAERYIVAQGSDSSSFVKAWIEVRADSGGSLDSK